MTIHFTVDSIFNATFFIFCSVKAPQKNDQAAFPFSGGETSAIERLHSYLWGTDSISTYKETRNGMIGTDYSTKFSTWY